VPGAHVGRQNLVASLAGARFDIGPWFDLDAVTDESGSDSIGCVRNSICLVQRIRSQTVVDMNRCDVQLRSSGESEKRERVGSTGDGAGHSSPRLGEVAMRQEIGEEGGAEKVVEASRFGDDSALVVAAALAPTWITIGRDLLQVTATESGDGENADHRQHDPDPPVPHICRKHVRQRSRLVAVATSVVGYVHIEAFEKTALEILGNRLFLGSLANVDHQGILEVDALLATRTISKVRSDDATRGIVEYFVEIGVELAHRFCADRIGVVRSGPLCIAMIVHGVVA
jgi:hypothetical protein